MWWKVRQFLLKGLVIAMLALGLMLFGLTVKFYLTGSSVEDSSTRRIFNVNFHGDLYVTPEEGMLFDRIGALEVVVGVCAIVLTFLKKSQESESDSNSNS